MTKTQTPPRPLGPGGDSLIFVLGHG